MAKEARITLGPEDSIKDGFTHAQRVAHALWAMRFAWSDLKAAGIAETLASHGVVVNNWTDLPQQLYALTAAQLDAITADFVAAVERAVLPEVQP